MKNMSSNVAILVEKDFHDLEFWYPYMRLMEEGIDPVVVAPVAPRSYTGKYGTHIEANYTPSSLEIEKVSAIVIPGGWAPDRLRISTEIVGFVKEVYENGGIVAGICHAGSLLVSAGILKEKRVTSYHSVKDDMILAGAEWVDESVVICERIITSRRPTDLPFFAKALLEELKK
jgi:protease I